MHDSLQCARSFSVARTAGKTVLHKAKAASHRWPGRRNYGEEQITGHNSGRLSKAGYGVASGHAIRRIPHYGRPHHRPKGNTFSIDTPLNADAMVGNKAQPPPFFGD